MAVVECTGRFAGFAGYFRNGLTEQPLAEITKLRFQQGQKTLNVPALV